MPARGPVSYRRHVYRAVHSSRAVSTPALSLCTTRCPARRFLYSGLKTHIPSPAIYPAPMHSATHGVAKAVSTCRHYHLLIVAASNGSADEARIGQQGMRVAAVWDSAPRNPDKYGELGASVGQWRNRQNLGSCVKRATQQRRHERTYDTHIGPCRRRSTDKRRIRCRRQPRGLTGLDPTCRKSSAPAPGLSGDRDTLPVGYPHRANR